MRARIWTPGQSPNPTGKGGLYQEALKLSREKAPRAVQRLGELMESEDERVAAVACNSILERAFGKPKEYDPRAEDPETPPIDPSQFTPNQRQMLREALQLVMNAPPMRAENE